MKTVAILGASSDRHKFGNKSVRAHLQAGYRVFPINPKETEIEGQTAYPTLAALPEQPERVSVYLPPAIGLKLLPDIAATDAREVFFNPGAADDAIMAEAERLGVPAIDGCSIVDLGLSPADFP
ncbi:MAG: CoA-binding protein [Acidobacteriota bacterium]